MAYTYAKLRGRIVEKFGTQQKFAEVVGLTETSISRKMNCDVQFSQADIVKWSELLDISTSEISEYFFA